MLPWRENREEREPAEPVPKGYDTHSPWNLMSTVSQPRRTSGAENMGSWGEDLLQRVLCMGRMQRAPENSPRGPDEEAPPTPMQKLTAVSQGVSGKLQETLVTMPKAAAEAAAAARVAAGAAVMRTFKKSEFRDPDMAHSSNSLVPGAWHHNFPRLGNQRYLRSAGLAPLTATTTSTTTTTTFVLTRDV